MSSAQGEFVLTKFKLFNLKCFGMGLRVSLASKVKGSDVDVAGLHRRATLVVGFAKCEVALPKSEIALGGVRRRATWFGWDLPRSEVGRVGVLPSEWFGWVPPGEFGLVGIHRSWLAWI